MSQGSQTKTLKVFTLIVCLFFRLEVYNVCEHGARASVPARKHIPGHNGEKLYTHTSINKEKSSKVTVRPVLWTGSGK